MLDDLDTLFKAARKAHFDEKAKAEARAKTKRGTKVRVEDEALTTEGIYRNPANWREGRSVALIHEDSMTLLGHFIEWNHHSVPNCRRLVRSAAVASPSVIEYVSGANWITGIAVPAKGRRPWQMDLPLQINLELLSLSLRASSVPVLACYGEGRLARVELTADQIFAPLTGPTELLLLPAGTNVYECLSESARQAIRDQLEPI